MSSGLKIASWNICLGLSNKKDFLAYELNKERIDVCCLQECEVPVRLDEKTLTLNNYKLELETNEHKKRTGIYISNRITYLRRNDLEELNTNIVIIDVSDVNEYRIINVYRSFSTYNNDHPLDKFISQLRIIRNAVNALPKKIPIVLGDFNLDYNKIYDPSYQFKNYFGQLNLMFEPMGLTQLVSFETWHRYVNGLKRSSVLDHIYTNTPEILSEICPVHTDIGDHCIVTFVIPSKQKNPKITLRRDWRFYDVNVLRNRLSSLEFVLDLNCVQQTWNLFENELLKVVDEIVPIVEFANDIVLGSQHTPKLNTLLNKKKRLLKKKSQSQNFTEHLTLKSIGKEIKKIIRHQKTKNVRKGIIPGNSKSLWNAVKKAKDLNFNSIPENMTLNSNNIPIHELPDSFADFFVNKVKTITNECKIDNFVYNGTRKLNVNPNNFMSPENVIAAVKSLKIKNCEGFDRIPVRILIDGINELAPVLCHLFQLIYEHKIIPSQWKISKVMPLLKSGNPTKIENYRPIANLCSTSKIFEKLILMRLTQLENLNDISLTGKSQHGFKKHHSTATLGLTLQSLIANALDENKYAIMASLDLSAAFDVVNVELLLKRLDIVGIPADVVSLIRIWLTERLIYVSVNGDDSCLLHSDTGTIQGSILGPILYAIFVAPLFDLEKLSNYADDNYIVRCSTNITELIIDMKKSLETITKWLKDSGLKVNEIKTEMCVFHRNEVKKVSFELNGTVIKSTPQIGVLGVIFDSKLKWTEQVSNVIKKSEKALNAIKIIKNHFDQTELLTLLTSNFYSILFYNSEIWHLPNLSPYLKTLLLSKSANALKICTPNYDQSMSFLRVHEINKRATPEKFCLYKHSLLLHSIYNTRKPTSEWLSLNFNQNFNERDKMFKVFNNSKFKIGKDNKISNRLTCLNNLIELDWLNQDKNSYKLLCKKRLL